MKTMFSRLSRKSFCFLIVLFLIFSTGFTDLIHEEEFNHPKSNIRAGMTISNRGDLENLELGSRDSQDGTCNSDSSYGPYNGSIVHHQGQGGWYEPGLSLSNFWASVTFFNPHSVEKGAWDYGIAFRGNDNGWLLLSVTSDSEWLLQCGAHGDTTVFQYGNLSNLDLSPNGSNSLEIQANGLTGHLFVNHQYISSLDLSCSEGPGDVSLSTAWFTPAINGSQTNFEAFNIGVCEGGQAPQAACEDSDNDGMCNDLEEWFATTFMPIMIYDEEEHNILINQDPEDFRQGNGVIYLHQVSTVFCYYLTDSDNGEDSAFYEVDYQPYGSGFSSPRRVLITLLGIYPYDYLPWKGDSGEEDILAHYGDVEAIRICVEDEDRDNNYQIDFVHFRRHKEDHVYRSERIPEWSGSHPILYTSEGKHGTYLTEKECRDALPWYQRLGWDEDCGGREEPIIPVSTIHYNVGEYFPNKKLSFSDIGLAANLRFVAGQIGSTYVEEMIWTPNYSNKNHREMYFCGSIDVEDFTGSHNVIDIVYDEDNCPGGLHRSWWIP